MTAQLMHYQIKQPETEEEFKQYFNFRWRLLRKTWDEPEGSEKDDIEDQCFHVMICDENKECIGNACPLSYNLSQFPASV